MRKNLNVCDILSLIASVVKLGHPSNSGLHSGLQLQIEIDVMERDHERDMILRDILKWFSPPDPSINFNIGCEVQHEGTAAWFFQGAIFKDWMSFGSLLWIHGKRKFFLSFAAQILMAFDLHSGIREEHPFVRHFPTIVFSNKTNND